MTETKTPQAGEYWISDDGSIIRIVGVKLNGGVIYENQAGFSFQLNSMTNWHYEPRCTSFDWVEPKLPDPGEGWELLNAGTVLQHGDEVRQKSGAWMTTCYPGEAVGARAGLDNPYRRKIKPVEPPETITADTDSEMSVMEMAQAFSQIATLMDCLRGGLTCGWRLQNNTAATRTSTEAEALARVKPDTSRPTNIHGTANDADETPEPCAMCGDVSCDCDCYKYALEATGCPVESPDDWVEITDGEHVLRAGIDQLTTYLGRWNYVKESHGKTATLAGYLKTRCRRRDLPVPMTLQSVAELCTSEPVKTPDVVTWGGTVPSAQRVPVRLFLDDRHNMFATRGEWPIVVGTQIKHDADGFYVECVE